MCRTLTVRQIQNLDTIAIERYDIPSIVLMENAGRAVAEEVKKSLRGKKKPRVCVVCGIGNNAGDGFVAARHLMNVGISVKVILVSPRQEFKHDAACHYQILKKIKCPILSFRPQEIARVDCVVDAIFGVGLNLEIAESFRRVIETINHKAKYVIAVDIPSGLNGTTGAIYGVCVKADKTVTFSFPKKGFFKNHGPHQTGKVIVADIGIPTQVIKRVLGDRWRVDR